MLAKKFIAIFLVAASLAASLVLVIGYNTINNKVAPVSKNSIAEWPRQDKIEMKFSHPEEAVNVPKTNITNAVAAEIASGIIANNPNGPAIVDGKSSIALPSEEKLNAIVSNYFAKADNNAAKFVTPEINNQDLRIKKGASQADIKEYLQKTLESSIYKNITKISVSDSASPEMVAKQTVDSADKIVNELYATPVPEEMVSLHKKQLAFYVSLRDYYQKVLETYQNDPATAVAILQGGSEILQSNISDINSEIVKISSLSFNNAPSEDNKILKALAWAFLIPEAKAQWITFDPTAVAQMITQFVDSTVKWLQAHLFEIVLQKMKDALIKSIVDSIVQSIQGGGSPRFITNWNAFLNDAFQEGVNQTLSELDAATGICGPFKLQIKVIAKAPEPRLSDQLNCTLDKLVGNINNFYNDFSNGGWLAYEEVSKPNNNLYGSLIMLWNDEEIKGRASQEAAKSQAQANQGFKSSERCIEWNNQGMAAAISNGMSAEEASIQYCTKWDTVTPGSSFAEMTKTALGADIQRIVGSRELTDALTQIGDALVLRLTRESVSAIRGLTTSSGRSVATGTTNTLVDAGIITPLAQRGCDTYVSATRKQTQNIANHQITGGITVGGTLTGYTTNYDGSRAGGVLNGGATNLTETTTARSTSKVFETTKITTIKDGTTIDGTTGAAGEKMNTVGGSEVTQPSGTASVVGGTTTGGVTTGDATIQSTTNEISTAQYGIYQICLKQQNDVGRKNRQAQRSARDLAQKIITDQQDAQEFNKQSLDVLYRSVSIINYGKKTSADVLAKAITSNEVSPNFTVPGGTAYAMINSIDVSRNVDFYTGKLKDIIGTLSPTIIVSLGAAPVTIYDAIKNEIGGSQKTVFKALENINFNATKVTPSFKIDFKFGLIGDLYDRTKIADSTIIELRKLVNDLMNINPDGASTYTVQEATTMINSISDNITSYQNSFAIQSPVDQAKSELANYKQNYLAAAKIDAMGAWYKHICQVGYDKTTAIVDGKPQTTHISACPSLQQGTSSFSGMGLTFNIPSGTYFPEPSIPAEIQYTGWASELITLNIGQSDYQVIDMPFNYPDRYKGYSAANDVWVQDRRFPAR